MRCQAKFLLKSQTRNQDRDKILGVLIADELIYSDLCSRYAHVLVTLLSPRICIASVIFDQSEFSFSDLWVSWESLIHVILYCVCRAALHFFSQMQSKWLIFMFAIKMILTNIKKQIFPVLTIIDTSSGPSVYAGRLKSTIVLPFILLALISVTFCSVSGVGRVFEVLQKSCRQDKVKHSEERRRHQV